MCVWSDFVSKSRLWEQKAIQTLWKNSLHVVFLARPICHRFSLSVFHRCPFFIVFRFSLSVFVLFAVLDQIVIVSRCPFLHCFPFLDLSLSSMSVSENPQQNHNNWSKEMKRNPKLLLRVQWVDLIDSDWDYSNHVAKPTFLGKTLNARLLQNYKLFVQSCNFVLDFVRVSTNAFFYYRQLLERGVSFCLGGDTLYYRIKK